MVTTRSEQVHKNLRSAVLTAFAFGFGTVTGLVGVGPGFIGAVSLVYLLGFNASAARSFVTVLILAAALPAILIYGVNGHVRWWAALEVAIGAVAGAVIGAALLRRRFLLTVRKVLALALIVVAVEMVLYTYRVTPSGTFHLTFGAVLLAGAVSGFVGSISAFPAGKFLVPILTLLLAVPQRGAQAIALAASIPASVPLTLTQYALGGVEKARLPQYMVAAALGGVLGAGLAVQLSSGALAVTFGCFLAVTAAAVFLRSSV